MNYNNIDERPEDALYTWFKNVWEDVEYMITEKDVWDSSGETVND